MPRTHLIDGQETPPVAKRFAEEFEPPTKTPKAGEYFKVRPVSPEDTRVILFERNENHPAGQVCIYGEPGAEEQRSFDVAWTYRVEDLVRDGRLELVSS